METTKAMRVQVAHEAMIKRKGLLVDPNQRQEEITREVFVGRHVGKFLICNLQFSLNFQCRNFQTDAMLRLEQ